MADDDLILRPFRLADEGEALAAQDELAADGFEFLLEVTDGQSWADYVARLDQISRGDNVAPDRVQADLLAAEVDGALVICDDANAGSAATIERCGGVFDRMVTFHDVPRRRYWVPTS